MKRHPSAGFTWAVTLVLLFFASRPVFGTDKSWVGNHNIAWSFGSNWSPSGVPGATDNAVFNSSFSGFLPSLGTTPETVGGIWMSGTVGANITINGTAVLTLNGNTISGTAGLGILVNNANAFTLTINPPILLGANQTWRNNSGNPLTIGGAVGTTSNTIDRALTIDGSGNITISGVVSGGGSITESGSGTLTLSGTNTFTGALNIKSGTLSIATINNASSNGVLGNSATAVGLGDTGTTGTLQYTGSTASSTKNFTMATGGTGAFHVTTSGTTLTLSGVIDGSGTLTKA